MSNNRKKYDEEFKKRAVRMSYSSERSFAAVAASLGVTGNTIYRWWKKYTPDGDKTQLTEQQGELSELRKRVAERGKLHIKKSVGLLRKTSEVKTTDLLPFGI